MKPEQEHPAPPKTGFRPPDFLLPKADSATRRRHGEPGIYLSWGGEVYGPAAVEDVISGIRTSWFADDALFWFEGQTEWRPVGEFPDIAAKLTPKRAMLLTPQHAVAGTAAQRPDAPRRPAMPKAPKHRRDYRGLGIVMIFVLLAVGLTAGLLVLLHLYVQG